jgi:acyl-CoA reductase-like NAD-dependent aldehyde dehydrogenase
MAVAAGSIVHPEGQHIFPATTREGMDAAVADLQEHKSAWVATSIQQRISYLEGIIERMHAVRERWVRRACEAKGIPFDAPVSGEEWFSGPVLVIRHARLLKESLQDILRHGTPQFPGPVTTFKGQTIVGVYPTNLYDRLLFAGISGEVWMEPGVAPGDVAASQAAVYQPGADREAAVGLVLGAGNIGAIPSNDTMSKMFGEDEVVVLKMNPVNEYLGPLMAEVFAELIDDGFLRIIYGGADEGSYLCHHDGVERIHITGSDKTHDAIVFGSGEEGARRKANREPLLGKPITSELGNVSPVVVVPGPWSESQVAYQGRNIASMLTHNAGFNCIAARVIVMPEDWNLREPLLEAIRKALEETDVRPAYYPGADERRDLFLTQHPEAGSFGKAGAGTVPWTLIEGIRAESSGDVCFTTEAFAGLFGEALLPSAGSTAEYLERAVSFCNEELWGTLGATVIVHPKTRKEPGFAAAFEQAIADLRYGTVAINTFVGAGYSLISPPWGAYPGHTMDDIGSGIGSVHNSYFFEKAQKAVVRAPFRPPLEPVWFPNHAHGHDVLRKLVSLEADPSPAKLPGIFWSALRG